MTALAQRVVDWTQKLAAGRYRRELAVALAAVEQAGQILLADFHRSGGPRGLNGKCPADVEAEHQLRRVLGSEFPDFGLRGEELPSQDRAAADPEAHVWLIDPNDGTSAFQKGWRGAAVSVGLVRSGEPVLGVVYAYAARAGYGDLIAWAEGQPWIHNDYAGTLPESGGGVPDTVFVSQAADGHSASNARLCEPSRFCAMPSIAYRMALVAAGRGLAAVSLNGPVDWDVAAGHALMKAAGLELLRWNGQPVTYDAQGCGAVGNCVAGRGDIARHLLTRDFSFIRHPVPKSTAPFPLTVPRPDAIVADRELLDRAQGCLLGQLAGDNLGSTVEFAGPAKIALQYGGTAGTPDLWDGGYWGLLAGQPTDDSELALVLARSIVKHGGYRRHTAARAYAYWFESQPFDVGLTTHQAFSAAAAAERDGGNPSEAALQAASGSRSQANGALMRVSPLAIYGHGLPLEQVADAARQDAALSHSHPVCRDANAVYCVAIALALRDKLDAPATYQAALDWAQSQGLHADVLESLQAARQAPPADYLTQMGWVRIALQNAFYQLLHADSAAKGIRDTVLRGGDTDTNAAIAGALLGAVHGGNQFPPQWVDRLLTCRPLRQSANCQHPRPLAFWPVDCLMLAERLVALGQRGQPAQGGSRS
jgi:ADP-ribosyl-[dinitrogen reductase] hydrolase